MKIFSWMHRQFHHKVAKNVDDDKVPMLENEAFDGWNEGILAIGTFGVDMFNDFKAKEDALMNSHALFFDDDGDHDDEMESPVLVQKASKHVFDHVKIEHFSPCDEVAKPKNHQEDVVENSLNVRRSRERITLADLLQEDSEDNTFKNYNFCYDHKLKVATHNNDNYIDNDNDNARADSIKSFLISKAKKKLVKDDLAKPIKRTKQLMRKMLRKKIHPDIGIQKPRSPSVACQEMDVHAI